MTIESASLRCLRIRKPRNASSKILFSCNLRTPNLLVLCVAATTPALDKFFMERAPLLHTLDLSDCHFNSTINMSATMLLMRFLSSPQGRGITTLLLPNCNLNDATLNQVYCFFFYRIPFHLLSSGSLVLSLVLSFSLSFLSFLFLSLFSPPLPYLIIPSSSYFLSALFKLLCS